VAVKPLLDHHGSAISFAPRTTLPLLAAIISGERRSMRDLMLRYWKTAVGIVLLMILAPLAVTLTLWWLKFLTDYFLFRS